MFQNKKAAPPALGEKFGGWGGPNVSIMKLPGGGAIQFDLDGLTLGDFRQMRDHYQINSSLSVLTFLMHQIEYRVDCEDKKQKEFYQEQIDNIWTPLVRAKSTSFWAGFSPNILQWENDVASRRVVLTKIKDLIPEESEVNWKKVDGAPLSPLPGSGTEKVSVYDGIKRWGGMPVPVENTYWYPLLMEHGNYYGRKLLRSAFQPWFFSILMHLFANRYFERFGEPTPIGRAPFDDEIRYGGKEMYGNEAMELILNQLRNRSAVVLPNDKTPAGDETTIDYDYQIEYLESQMRGADFERYMGRLDEEMSLAMFTPILMMRAGDTGSYNMVDVHKKTYQSMMNAIAGDWKFYIDWYILRPMRDYNFGTNAPLPKIKFKRMGAENEELIRDVIRAMLARNTLEPADIEQLGEVAGLDLKIVRQLTGDEGEQPEDPSQPSQKGSEDDDTGDTAKENRTGVHRVAAAMSDRVEQQVRNAYKRDKVREATFDLGFQARFSEALVEVGLADTDARTRDFYNRVEQILRDYSAIGFETPDIFMTMFRNHVDSLVDQIVRSVRR
jgi:hypothetical protein